MGKSINIFCILSRTGGNRHRYLNDILSDKRFIRKNHLKRLIYTTTRVQKENEYLNNNDEYNHITIKEFKSIDQQELIEYRSYYTLDQGTVYYCTKQSDFDVNNNLICIASPYQFEYYKQYCDNQNIIAQYKKYNLYAILIDCRLICRLKNIISRVPERNVDINMEEIQLYDICRRIISEKNEFDDVFKRVPELNHPMISKNICYIDANDYDDNDFYQSNLEDIKKFIQFHCR